MKNEVSNKEIDKETEKDLSSILSFWKNLSKEQQEKILAKTIKITKEKGSFIHLGGKDECIGLSIVKSGQVRAFINSPNGSEITLYRLLDNDVSIFSASCMIKSLDFEMTMEFEKETELYIIPRGTYEVLHNDILEVKEYNLSLISEKFSHIMWLFGQYIFSNMAKRLADSLLEHRALAGSDEFKITHEMLAKDLGSAREVVTRLLKQFQIDGLVKLSRGKVLIIDAKKLASL